MRTGSEPRADDLPTTVARQINRIRKVRGVTVAQLADECARLGAPHLTQSSLNNIERGLNSDSERGRRHVHLTDLATIAKALGVAPIALMFPSHVDSVAVLPTWTVDPLAAARWFTGQDCEVCQGQPPKGFRCIACEVGIIWANEESRA